MPDYEVTSPRGKTYRITAPEGATEDQVMEYARTEFAKLEAEPEKFSVSPMEQPGLLSRYLGNHPGTTPETNNTWGQAVKNVGQGLANLGTSITGGLSGQAAGLGTMVADAATLGKFDLDPQKVRDDVTQALTYQPEDPKSLTMAPMRGLGWMVGGSSDYLGEKTKGIPYVESMARGVPEATMAALGGRAAKPATFKAPTTTLVDGVATTRTAKIPVPEKFVPPKISGANAQERARNFVSSRTNLDWDRLSTAFRTRLEEVAATADNLERLDATAIERQGLLASLDRPITNPTRGQVTRDPLQQRTEQLLKATEKGAELKVRDLEQNAAILENLDILQGRTGGRARGDIETGRSVQTALRTRLADEQARVRRLYQEAEEAGELQGPANIDRLVEYLRNHEDPAQVSYAMSRLRQLGAITEETNGGITVSANKPLTLRELEGIRRAAVAAGKDGGTKGYYAGELRRVIDEVTEGAGGERYRAARAARREVGEEFERQGAVARLVEEKRMSHDRATALEDTWHKTVLNGSLEEIQTVRESLSRAGPRGEQAWNDIKGATVSYIRDRATGGQHGIRNERGESHVTWANMRRAVDEIGPDKLREIFGPEDARKIETIVDAVQILKTEAPMGVKGSPTIDKLLTVLDKIGNVPVLGGPVKKVAEGAQFVKNIGKAERDLKKATTTPLDDK